MSPIDMCSAASAEAYIPANPWNSDDTADRLPAGGDIHEWGLHIDAPLLVTDPALHAWDAAADVVVVGLGGAGVAASLEALEQGLSVIALERYQGGGSSAASGGVLYAGGGTAIQRAAGITDTAAQMEAYLRYETGDVVAAPTLRKFCEESRQTLDWLQKHGVPFDAHYWPAKTSFPPLDRFLYHPDSSLAGPFRALTPPVARGHRVKYTNGSKAWNLGFGIWEPLRKSALARGLRLFTQSEVRQLAVDGRGRIIGVRCLQFTDDRARRAHASYIRKAGAWMGMLPPSFPGSRLTIARGSRLLAAAIALEQHGRASRWIRAEHGVVLSSGGFICNPAMVRHFAPKYADGLPNGVLSDDGSGIMLGVSAGGEAGLMDRVSAWRFLSPPAAWGRAMLVNGDGERFCNEQWYGARIGDEMVERQGGRGYIIMDRTLFRRSLKDAFGKGVLGFQRDLALVNALFAATRARSPAALAHKMGFDESRFAAEIAAYNRSAQGGQPDRFHKSADEMARLERGPWYAIDASVDARLFPLTCMTVGGLVVDEETGAVRKPAGGGEQGGIVPGLYAAGRNAVGLCSNLYVSGLSYADCIFSGRRAARAIKAASQSADPEG